MDRHLRTPGAPIAAKVAMRPIGYRRNGSAIWPIAGGHPAPPSVRGVGTWVEVAASPISPPMVSGWQAGDLHIVVIENSGASATFDIAAPSGWQKLVTLQQPLAGGTGLTRLSVFARIAVDGDTAPSFTFSSSNHAEAQMFGVQAGTHGVSDVTTDIVVGTPLGTVDAAVTGIPSITVSVDSLILLCIAVSDDALDTDNITAWTNANLANITEQFDRGTNAGAGGGVALWSATCAGTTTGQSAATHDSTAHGVYVHLGIPPASTGQTVALGTASETDSADAFTPDKGVNQGTASEADTAPALTIARIVALGTASEVDSADALSGDRGVSLGTASEVDDAGAFSTPPKVSTATEAETAGALSVARGVNVGTAPEVDSAGALGPARVVPIGTASESDAAGVLSQAAPAIGTSSETDAAGALSVSRQVSLGTAGENDAAGGLAPADAVPLGTASEVETAGALAEVKVVPLGTASEVDTGGDLAVAGGIVRTASESDTAAPLSVARVVAIGTASESDAAGALGATRAFPLGTASEVDTSGGLSLARVVEIGLASEEDAARGFAQYVRIGTASETDTAWVVGPAIATPGAPSPTDGDPDPSSVGAGLEGELRSAEVDRSGTSVVLTPHSTSAVVD